MSYNNQTKTPYIIIWEKASKNSNVQFLKISLTKKLRKMIWKNDFQICYQKAMQNKWKTQGMNIIRNATKMQSDWKCVRSCMEKGTPINGGACHISHPTTHSSIIVIAIIIFLTATRERKRKHLSREGLLLISYWGEGGRRGSWRRPAGGRRRRCVRWGYGASPPSIATSPTPAGGLCADTTAWGHKGPLAGVAVG